VAIPSYPALAFAILVVLPVHIWRAKVEEEMNLRIFGEKYRRYSEEKRW